MFVSSQEKFPNIDSPSARISISGSVILSKDDAKDELDKGVFYISVMGYDISDYTISVAVQRKGTP